jgi:hypothetical protein
MLDRLHCICNELCDSDKADSCEFLCAVSFEVVVRRGGMPNLEPWFSSTRAGSSLYVQLSAFGGTNYDFVKAKGRGLNKLL